MLTEKERNSPFKFLDAYRKEDRDIYFGRLDETLELYKLIRGHRSVVVFGPSGTGKTSLIQCGLTMYMESADWFSVYLRRGQGFLNSLAEYLIKSGFLKEADRAFNIDKLGDALRKLGTNKLRPIYLIFDQFEELVILGNNVETEELIEFFQLILNNEDFSFCNLIFSIREEYIGSMEPLVKEVPGLMDHRLRLQSMLRDMAREVITNSCEEFDITITRENVETILDKLEENGVIQLPYLQVYLDQHWRCDYDRTFEEKNGKIEKGASGFSKLEFTTTEINLFGGMKDVIQRFLSEQSIEIETDLLKKAKNYTRGMLDKILNSLVTGEGTKLPLQFFHTGDRIRFEGQNIPPYLKNLEEELPELLTQILLKLEERRIITSNKNHYELAHDKIAELIFQRRTKEKLDQLEAVQQLESLKEKKIPLSEKQLHQIEDVFPVLQLDAQTKQFYLRSKRRSTRRKMIILVSPLLVIIGLLTFMVIGLVKKKKDKCSK